MNIGLLTPLVTSLLKRLGILAPDGTYSGGLSGLGSTDNAVVRTDGTGGDRVQGSSVTIDDTGTLAPRAVLFSSTGMITDSGSAVALQGSAAGTGLALGSGAVVRWGSGTSYTSPKDTGLKRSSAGVVQVTDGGSGGGMLKVGTYTFATLPSAATVGAGTIAYVTDGGAGGIPALMFSDGMNWLALNANH